MEDLLAMKSYLDQRQTSIYRENDYWVYENDRLLDAN
jgi:hypothetical protein